MANVKVNGAALTTNTAGDYVFNPPANANGNFTVTYDVTDGTVNTAASLGFTLAAVNDAPVAVNDSVSTTDLQPVTFNVLANDSDVDTGDVLSILSFTNPCRGTVVKNANNTFTYTPVLGFAGNTSFNYTVKDLAGLTSTATVALNVTAGINNILGTSGNDNLVSTNRKDILQGFAGNDTLNGAAGASADTLIGGSGDDIYLVGAGDVIVENPGEGTDLVKSSVSFSIAPFNNVENFTLTGNAAINATGNNLDNVIAGNSAANILNGGDGKDTLNGNEGNDTLNGGAGNDLLNGGAGNDSMFGGAGDDTYVVDSGSDIVTENLGEGTDLVQSSVTWTLSANVENLTLTGSGAINGTGNGLNNVITGNSGKNTLNGDAGNDLLNGDAGNDSLNGGDGNDTLIGGNGSDTMTGGAGNDRFVYNAFAERTDTITDFNTTQDILNLKGVFSYLGSTPVNNTYVRFQQSGSNTLVQVDLDGTVGGANFSTLVTLNGVNTGNLSIGNNVLVNALVA